MNPDDFEAELIKQQQDPRHDQSAFKHDVVCPTTGGDYVTTITGPTYTSAVESYNNNYNYTFSGGSSDGTVTINMNDYELTDSITLEGLDSCIPAKDFVTHIPSLEKIEKMCEQYPGLKKAYEHFVFAYKLTQQDYDGKVKAGELDD